MESPPRPIPKAASRYPHLTSAKASYRISMAMFVTALNYLVAKTKSVLNLESVPRCEKGGLSGLLQPLSLRFSEPRPLCQRRGPGVVGLAPRANRQILQSAE